MLSAGAHPWTAATASASAASSDPNNAVTGFSDVTSSQQLVTGSSPVAALQPQHQQQQHGIPQSTKPGVIVSPNKKRPKAIRSPLIGGSMSGGETGSDPGLDSY